MVIVKYKYDYKWKPKMKDYKNNFIKKLSLLLLFKQDASAKGKFTELLITEH